jgi:hypothetical protein
VSGKSLSAVFILSLTVLVLLISTSFLNFKIGNVLGKSYPPPEADIKAHTGGTVTDNGITLIVSEKTFDQDVYFRVDKIVRNNPIAVDGLWQISDIWETRVKFMSNNDQVTEYAAHENYILSFPYTTQFLTTDQAVALPRESLRLVRGETASGPWTVLPNSVVDQANKTVSVITNRGGFFMIAGGFHQPPKSTTYPKNNPPSKIVSVTPSRGSPPPLPSKLPATPLPSFPPSENTQSGSSNFFTAILSAIRSFLQKL